jgi:hypothetical protein
MLKTTTTVKLTGEDGNVFNIIGLVSKALKKDGKVDFANEFTNKAFNCGSYDEVLRLAMNYCQVE